MNLETMAKPMDSLPPEKLLMAQSKFPDEDFVELCESCFSVYADMMEKVGHPSAMLFAFTETSKGGDILFNTFPLFLKSITEEFEDELPIAFGQSVRQARCSQYTKGLCLMVPSRSFVKLYAITLDQRTAYANSRIRVKSRKGIPNKLEPKIKLSPAGKGKVNRFIQIAWSAFVGAYDNLEEDWGVEFMGSIMADAEGNVSDSEIDISEAVEKGACSICGTTHRPEVPHNRGAAIYQFRFASRFGRPPTWDDAAAHCIPEIKVALSAFLTMNGEDVDSLPPGVRPIAHLGEEPKPDCELSKGCLVRIKPSDQHSSNQSDYVDHAGEVMTVKGDRFLFRPQSALSGSDRADGIEYLVSDAVVLKKPAKNK